jgi:hypothetical protein
MLDWIHLAEVRVHRNIFLRKRIIRYDMIKSGKLI